MQFAESGSYDQGPIGQEYSSMPRNNQEPIKGGFGLSVFNQKQQQLKPNGTFRQANNSTPSLLMDASTRTLP